MKDRTVRTVRWMATEGCSRVSVFAFIVTSGGLQMATQLSIGPALGTASAAGLVTYLILLYLRKAV